MRCFHCMKHFDFNPSFCPYCGQNPSAQNPVHALPTGTVLNGKYIVGSVIGSGGFGITYVGYDQTLNLKVAVKEYFPLGVATRNNTASNEITLNVTDNEEYYQKGKSRFLSEARNIARFSNEEGVVDVRDYFTENGTAYIVMEYLDGVDLGKYLSRNGRLDAKQTFEMMLPLMRSLQKMHGENVLHRDIAPDNLMLLRNGNLKLMDFGSAKQLLREGINTMSVLIKQGYSPIEQYSRKGAQGPWTDVYSLCATIYKCITGITPPDSLDRSITDDLQAPSSLGVQIPQRLEDALMKGLAIRSENRWQSMDGLIESVLAADDTPAVMVSDSQPDEEQVLQREDYPPTAFQGKTEQADPSVTQDREEKPPVREDEKPPGPQKNLILLSAVTAVLVCIAVLAFVLIWNGFSKDPPVKTTSLAGTEVAATTDADSTTEDPTDPTTTELETIATTAAITDPPTEPQTEEQPVVQTSQEEQSSEAQELFRNIANMEFLMGASHTQSVLTIYENGTFQAEYRQYSAENGGTNYVTKFTGRFADVIKVNDYLYSMTVADVRLTSKEGMVGIEDGINSINTDFVGEMREGAAIMLYTPDTPVSVICERYSLSQRNGKLIDGKMFLSPNGEYLNYYFLDTGAHYWQKKN